MKKEIKKILIANRGEIAIRVMRTCRIMGIRTVAVFSEADRNSIHVSYADEAIEIGEATASESYLNQDKIILAAKQTGADAIHPGYGFLSENASFSKRCEEEGIIFIGPAPEAIVAMGAKDKAKEIAVLANVPVITGYSGSDQKLERMLLEADKMGYPLLVKAAAGGGGKGMRVVLSKEKLKENVESAAREALKSFGDDNLLLEKYFESAKHIEIQVFGDKHGNYLHFFERECSVQRRYQKIIEEAPSPSVSPELRKKMGEAAISIVQKINYTNAGTVEFLLDTKGDFYFLEVNTRLQVEHPVTEEITGFDLVRLQIEVAEGKPFAVKQEDLSIKGHSIEVRIYAEDPENSFFPSTGKIHLWKQETFPGLRYENGVETGSRVEVHYDPMISKIIATGENRKEAARKLRTALTKFASFGIRSNRDFLIAILEHPEFLDGSFDTMFLAKEFSNFSTINKSAEHLNSALIGAVLTDFNNRNGEPAQKSLPLGWRNNFNQNQFTSFEIEGAVHKVEYRISGENQFAVFLNSQEFPVSLISNENNLLQCRIGNRVYKFITCITEKEVYVMDNSGNQFTFKQVPRFPEIETAENSGGYKSPLPGEIIKILVKKGDFVKSGSPLIIMSSMKMETTIEAVSDGTVDEVFVEEKKFVEADTVLLHVVESKIE